mmetsp:Transcript_42376/g.90163  ORF Transcript_42376/g.90163 Transcript_42376/m.90163 type:complete len:385 (+) Transcript_42376:117-1271(+)
MLAIRYYQPTNSRRGNTTTTPGATRTVDHGHEIRHRKRRARRRFPKGMQWLFLGFLLGVYLDRTSELIAATMDGPLVPTQHSSIHNSISSPSRRQSVLSKRIITVFGTESSGSTFLATTLGIASGAFPPNGTYVTLLSDRHNSPGRTIVERTVARRARSPDGEIEVQHLSLPWGFWGSKRRNCDLRANTSTVDAFVPEPCFRFDYQSTWEHRLAAKAPAGCREEAHITERNDGAVGGWTCGTNDCGRGENDGYALYPRRFFVNATAHLEWHLRRGVDITVVLVVRDKSISRAGKMTTHCPDETAAREEEEKARAIMSDALRNYGRLGRLISSDNPNEERAIAVSYETLMALEDSYLLGIYKMLGINSTFIPDFKDGNKKYVSAR